MNDEIKVEFPGAEPSWPLRALAAIGIIVPLAILLPSWWGRPALDWGSLAAYLACAMAPIPFGAWIGEAFGELPRARRLMLAGLLLALVGALAGYAQLIVSGGAGRGPPETMLVVPLGQLLLVLVTAFAAFIFGRR